MTIQLPLISVIMPCFNAMQVIEKTIVTLYQQSFKDFELIVIDDGSTDGSLELLDQLSNQYNTLTILTQGNKGPGSARNRGVKNARGKFIAFLDADDSWHPEFLSKLYNCLIESPDCILAYCGWQNTGLTQNRCQPFVPPDYELEDKLATLLANCPWPIHAAMTYKSSIESVKGFNERWLTAEDFDMWLRIAAFGKIVLVPEVLAYYHHEEGEQISKNKLRATLNHWCVQLAFLRDFPNISDSLGLSKVVALTDGKLLQKAYESYWQGDLITAHVLFRKILFLVHFQVADLKYILPALLPFKIYKILITKLRHSHV